LSPTHSASATRHMARLPGPSSRSGGPTREALKARQADRQAATRKGVCAPLPTLLNSLAGHCDTPGVAVPDTRETRLLEQQYVTERVISQKSPSLCEREREREI
jgi:hypothetical protein